MTLDEQELRQHLKTVAGQVGAHRFSIELLTGRIRRRRAQIIGAVSASLLAVAALAVAVPVALGGAGTAPTTSAPKAVRPGLLVTVVVNGQSRLSPKDGPSPSFTVSPGEHLRIHIGVIVPTDAKVTNLWLGVARGGFGSPGPDGQRPAGVRPVLAHTRKPLTPGLHTFRLSWTMPAQLPRGTSLWLVAAWGQQDASIGQAVAELVTPR
jgi:hypothetical protein